MSTNKYFELHIAGLTRDQEDAVTGLLFGLGAAGVSENLKFVQENLQFSPEVVETEDVNLIAYFEACAPDVPERVRMEFPAARVSLKEEDNKDWMEEWKKGFEPFALAESAWIVPSWRTPPSEAKNVIYIDPGMAFGTGTHETTRVCAELITSYARTETKITAVDVGTGTGILAILMEKLGFERVYCTDIDPECRRVSMENFAKNDVSRIIWEDEFVTENRANAEGTTEKRNYDLIVANIIDGVLTALKEQFKSVSGPKTQIILSGILSEREEDFVRGFLRDWPLRVHERRQMGEWVGLWLKPVEAAK